MDYSEISEIPEDRFGSEADILKLMNLGHEEMYDEETLLFI